VPRCGECWRRVRISSSSGGSPRQAGRSGNRAAGCAAIEEAHRAGVRVAVHATHLEVARGAVLAGADVLVHSVDDHRVDDGFIRLLRERDVVYVTTLGVNEGYREVFEQRFKPTDSGAESRGCGGARHPRRSRRSIPVEGRILEALVPALAGSRIAFWNLRRLHEAGITVAAGSDAGNIGTLHGPALHREMERMAEAGLAPLAILEAATQGGARAMGRASELGTVEPGKRADLLVLDADPQSDLRNTRRIHRVVRGGGIVTPKHIAKAASGQPPASEAERAQEGGGSQLSCHGLCSAAAPLAVRLIPKG
jgi:imidazolonepropionase-like amidohydrolase